MMEKFSCNIYRRKEWGKQNPVPYCVVKRLKHNEVFMGDDSVTVSVEYPSYTAADGALFKVGDWLLYRGVKYVIDVPPSVKKNARKNTVGNAFIFDSIKFTNQLIVDMTYTEFRDVTNRDDNHNFTARSFALHCTSLLTYAYKLKANLDREHKGEYHIYVHGQNESGEYIDYLVNENEEAPEKFTASGKQNMVVNFNDENCCDSLSHLKETFDVNFIIVGNSIFLGRNGKFLSNHYFRYGKGNGLFKIEKTTDTSDAIITKLRAYGAETNMPVRYYKNISLGMLIRISGISDYYEEIGGYVVRMANAYTFNSGMFTKQVGEGYTTDGTHEDDKYHDFEVKISIDDALATAIITTYDNGISPSAMVIRSEGSEAIIAKINGGKHDIIIYEGVVSKRIPVDMVISNPNCKIPNNMNVKCLMLPGFGFTSLYEIVDGVFDDGRAAGIRVLKDYYDESKADHGFADFLEVYTLSDNPTDPWIVATQRVEEYGVREGNYVFDKDNDGEYDSIYPSIKYVRDQSNLLPVQALDDNIRVDDGVCDDLTSAGVQVPQWYLYVKDPGFNPYNQRPAESTQITVSFKTGMLGGRSFECTSAVMMEDGTYRLALNRKLDDSLDLYFPYKASNGRASFIADNGDEIVYLDIEMPSVYVDDAALYELLPAALEVLDKNCDPKYKFSLEIDKVMMAKQHEDAVKFHEISLHDTLRAGDVIWFGDDDLEVNMDEGYKAELEKDTITAAVIIENIEITENEDMIPKYTVSLTENHKKSTIERIQKQIDGIVNGTTLVGSSATFSVSDVQRMIYAYGDQRYLGKSGGNITGSLGIGRNLVVNGNAEVKGELHVTKLTADSVEIMEAKHISGKIISSPASAKIVAIDKKKNDDADPDRPTSASYNWDLLFYAEDEDGNEVNNMFAVDDMVWCEQFSVDENGDYFTNKVYWKRVSEIGRKIYEGKEYNYVTVDVRNFAGDKYGGTPEIGDEIIVLGNLTVKSRQNATISSPVGQFSYKGELYDAPYECQYVGIGEKGFNMPDPINAKSPGLTIIRADKVELTSGQDPDEFSIYSVDWEAESERDEDGNPHAKNKTIGYYDVDVSHGWDEDACAAHIGDYLVTSNGFCYRFVFDSDSETYVWRLIEDELLLKIQEQIKGIQQSGIRTQKDFVEMWSDVVSSDEGKALLASAGVSVGTWFNEEVGKWWSGIKIYANDITIDADNALNLTAKSFTLDTDNLKIDADGKFTIDTYIFKINSDGEIVIDAENFKIDADGNVSMSGSITAKSGTIGGFTIGEDILTYGNVSNYDTNNGSYFGFSPSGFAYNKITEVGNGFQVERYTAKIGMNGTGTGSQYSNSVAYFYRREYSNTQKSYAVQITGETYTSAQGFKSARALRVSGGKSVFGGGVIINGGIETSTYAQFEYGSLSVIKSTVSNHMRQLPTFDSIRSELGLPDSENFAVILTFAAHNDNTSNVHIVPSESTGVTVVGGSWNGSKYEFALQPSEAIMILMYCDGENKIVQKITL